MKEVETRIPAVYGWTLFVELPDGEVIIDLTVYQGRLFATTLVGHVYEIYENGGWIRMDEALDL